MRRDRSSALAGQRCRDPRLRIVGRVLGLVLWLLGPLIAPSPGQAWFDCLWTYRTEITITENSGGTLTDYQVPVDLTASDLNGAYVWSTDGRDLRVIDTDDLTELEFFVESWDSVAQTARVWVRFPVLAANAARPIFFYYGNADATSESTGFTFTNPGIRFHTRNSTTNPASGSQAFAAFDGASDGVAGYGCTFITNFTGITNRNQFSPPSRNGNFIALSESFFEVRPGEEGIWSFRYGADFGWGGGLYVDDVPLEEQWPDDLWWANNWNNSTEVLEGSISLTAGYHKLEVIGGEGCCDGGITVQYRRPGGAYQTFTTSTIDVRSRECPVTEPTIGFGANGLQQPALSIAKTVEVVEDPMNGTTNPKAIPGARVRYTVSVTNLGDGASDTDSIVIEDAIPANTQLYVQGVPPIGFADGPVSSGLSLDFAGLSSAADDLAFSDDGGSSYGYAPTPDGLGADASVTHIRITPSGRFRCQESGATPSFTTQFEVLVE